jgi:hypothetical protein
VLDIYQQRQAFLEAEGFDPRLPALGEQTVGHGGQLECVQFLDGLVQQGEPQ